MNVLLGARASRSLFLTVDAARAGETPALPAASIGDMPIAAPILYSRHIAKTPPDVTPRDANVTAM